MKIISYNLSWATQLNIVAGSEKNFVEQCHKLYGKSNKALSHCTNNALTLLMEDFKKKPFDILCIQEGIHKTPHLLKHFYNDYIKSIDDVAHLYTSYNRKLLGKAYLVTPFHFGFNDINKKYEKGRPIQVIYFPETNILLINAHFPHSLTKKDYMKLFNMFNLTEKVDRIIFCGDFNDHETILPHEITINNMKLYIKSPIPKTCCYPKYNKTSDYIYDSKKQEKFGIIPIFKKSKLLASDHYPVYAIT